MSVKGEIMENTWKTEFHRMLGWVSLPVCIMAIMSLVVSHAAQAEQMRDQDKIVLTSAIALNDAAMDIHRGSGGTSTTVSVTSNQSLSATSTGNTMNVGGNLTNGSIATGNDFGGSGFGSFVMNTGNNSTINSGVSVSILMLQ
jgi:hypothetical protein